MVEQIGLFVEGQGRADLRVVLVFTLLLLSTTSQTNETVPGATKTTTRAAKSTLEPLAKPVPKAPRLLSVSRYRAGWSPAWLIIRWETLSISNRKGAIIAYEVNYVGDEFDTNIHSVNVSGSVNSLILSGLEEYVVYDVKIRAYTSVGPGPFSANLSERTYAARPANPVVLSIQNVSSSSSIDGLADLKVTWSNPSPRDVNGLFVGIQMTLNCSFHGYFSNRLFSSYDEASIQMMCDCNYRSEMNFLKNGTEFVITNLTSYSWYNVYVYALSKDESLGYVYVSNSTSDVVLTAESMFDIPGGKELLVKWNEVSCNEINGMLKEYVIYYQKEGESLVLHVTSSPDSTNFTISNLEPLNEYSVWMQAVTGAGEGPRTSIVKARTAQRVCECFLNGSFNENCNLTTGQCLCLDGAYGQNCETCIRSLKRFDNITECLDEIDYTPFNCLDPPPRWPRGCSDVAQPSREPTPLHVSPTIVSGSTAVRNRVKVYWNGWTCFFACPLTYTWKVYVLVLESQGSFLKKLSHFINSYPIRSQPVPDPIQTYVPSGMNMIELTVTHGSYTSRVVRSYVLVDKAEGSSVAISTRHMLHFSSTTGNSHWQTDRNGRHLNVSWENHFYNSYIKTNPSLLYRIERLQTGDDFIVSPLSFSGIPTYNDSGIMSFEVTLYQNNSLIASQTFTAVEQRWVYLLHSKPFQSGETYRVDVTAIDVFGHQAHSSALFYTDFTQPTISDVNIWKGEHSSIRDLDLCLREGNRSVYTLEGTAMDEESGIETIEWKSLTTSGQIDSQSQLQCRDRDKFCYCALDGVCRLKRFKSELKGFEASWNGNGFNLQIQATSRSGLKSKWEKFTISAPMTATISPTLERLTSARRAITVKWSLSSSSTSFLVFACQKDLETAKCVTCFEVSVDESQREAQVEDLRPDTIYQVQIEAFEGNTFGLSAPKETKTQEDSPERSPIDIAVTTRPNRIAQIAWKPPDLFYRNGDITGYKVMVEIEKEGQWVLAQAEIGVDAPHTTTAVNHLPSGQKLRTRVSAATAIGFGPPSAYYDFTTPEDVPDVSPCNVSVIDATKSSVTISWNEIPKYSRNGVLREYVVTYFAQKFDEPEKTVEVRGTETSATLSGLLPYTSYVIKVSGRTNIGPGPVSDGLIVQTSEGVPGPPLLKRADAASVTAISVSWKVPSKPNGRILDYRFFVLYSSNRSSAADFTDQGSESNTILTNLVEGTNYSIYMRARTSQGLGERTEAVYVATLKRIIGAPQELNATSNTSDSILVSWLAPSFGNGSGYVNISRYVIMYGVADDGKQNVTTTNEFYVLTGLSPYTYYQIEVKAEGGNASAVTVAYTLEGTPGPLESFRISDVDESSVLLKWEPPSSPNGRIAYRYCIAETATGFRQDVDLLPGQLDLPVGRFFRWKVSNLTGYTEYQFSMRAFNILHNFNVGPSSELLVIRSNEGKPGPPDAVRVFATRYASLIVSWSPPKKPNGIITDYEISTQWANETGTPKTITIIHVIDVINAEARFQNVEGLQFPVNYSVIVRAITSSGRGAASEQIFEFSKFLDPEPSYPGNVNHINLTSTSVTLIWERPWHYQGLLNYTLSVTQLDGPTSFTKRVVNKDKTSATVEELLANTLYSVKLVAGFADGSLGSASDLHVFQTPPSAPSSAPRNFTVIRTEESSTLLLSWIAVLKSDLNGAVCNYVVRYSKKNIPNAEWSIEDINAGNHETLLQGLAPYTEYHVEIAAETCGVSGIGLYASGRNRTREGVPNAPDIFLVERNLTWIKVKWTVEPNGILFRVDAKISFVHDEIYNTSVYNTSKVTGEAEFFGLEPYHPYTVSIRAYSGRGAGLPGTLLVFTCGEAPRSAALNLTCEHLGDNGTEIRLKYTDIPMSDWRGERQGYRVNLFKGNETSVSQVYNDTTLYVGKSVDESNIVEIKKSTVDFDQWYTVTLQAESDSKCNRKNVGPSSDLCSFFIPNLTKTLLISKPTERLFISQPTSETLFVPKPAETVQGTAMTIVIAIASSVAALLIIVLVIVIVFVQKRRIQAKLEVIQLQELPNQRQTHWLMKWPTYDEFQFSKERLKIEDELGEGQFGKVYFAWATGILKGEEKTRVAVKTMKQGSSQETAEDFRKEMEIMMDFDHPNIVRLLGICTHDEPLYLITELMKHGDLKAYIRKARPIETHPRSLLSVAQLVDIAAQAAAGVAYLASRLFVHCDIAARNCLVGENGDQLSVKVSDFGMARDIYQEEYYRRKGGTMPIRWMAPEAITDGKYTVESDAWSLGVLLWEIFVFGYQPYFGKSHEQVIDGILQGSLSLECPSLCPKSVYQFMRRCWERDPSDRIKSSDVANALQAMRDMGDISAGHLDMSPTESKVVECTPMSSFTSRGTELDPMNEENASLPDVITMNRGNPSSPSDQKRNTHAEVSQKEREEVNKKKKEKALSSPNLTTYVNVMASTEDLDSATKTGKDDPSA
ncbi:uncharacterized protein [Oscarella lobularis]|uniref:uncharacterized protein isoform X3 n=1 Tax=Oscarella lobularis TaxID=121494 RepID=UPI00331345E2